MFLIMFLPLHFYVFPLDLKTKHKIIHIIIIIFTDREIEEAGMICPQLPTRPKAGLGTKSITLHYSHTLQPIRDCDTCHPNT